LKSIEICGPVSAIVQCKDEDIWRPQLALLRGFHRVSVRSRVECAANPWLSRTSEMPGVQHETYQIVKESERSNGS
jgi:hypothetical protein